MRVTSNCLLCVLQVTFWMRVTVPELRLTFYLRISTPHDLF